MKVLCLLPQNPYPAVTGGKMGLLYPMLELARLGHQVAAFFIHDSDGEAAQTCQFLQSRGIRAVAACLDTADSPLAVLANIGRSTPFKMAKYYSPHVMSVLAQASREFGPEIVQSQHPHMARYALGLLELLKVSAVLREHNIEYELVEEYSRHAPHLPARAVACWQGPKTRRYEVDLWRRFDGVAFISPVDLERARRDCPDVRGWVVQDGIAEPHLDGLSVPKTPNSVIFSGNLKTLQNLTAAVWLIEQVWPAVRAKLPLATLSLTGGGESLLYAHLNTDPAALAAQGVTPLGFVDDIEKTIASCGVFVSPTQFGSGIRLKVLMAMALGMAVVCTSVDAQSICGAAHGRELHVADGADQFASGIAGLLKDPSATREMGLRARELVATRFRWEHCAAGLAEVYRQVLTATGRATDTAQARPRW